MPPSKDGKTSLTIRITTETHNRLHRLFMASGGPRAGSWSHPQQRRTFRTFVAAYLDETSIRADEELEMLKKSWEAIDKERPIPPPLPKK